MTLENKTIDKIMAYLVTRPWQEVENIIHEITNQIAEQQKITEQIKLDEDLRRFDKQSEVTATQTDRIIEVPQQEPIESGEIV